MTADRHCKWGNGFTAGKNKTVSWTFLSVTLDFVLVKTETDSNVHLPYPAKPKANDCLSAEADND